RRGAGGDGRECDARPAASADAGKQDREGQEREAVMMALLIESAVRSLMLGLAVWLALRLFRMRNPQLEITAWILVLIASLSMPLLMRGVTVTIPTRVPPQLVDLPFVSRGGTTDALTSPHLQPEALFPPPMLEPDAAHPQRIAIFTGLDWRSLA